MTISKCSQSVSCAWTIPSLHSWMLIISHTACLFYDHAITFGMQITGFTPELSHLKGSARSRDRLPMEETQDPQLVLVFCESVSGIHWKHSSYYPRFHDAIDSGIHVSSFPWVSYTLIIFSKRLVTTLQSLQTMYRFIHKWNSKLQEI